MDKQQTEEMIAKLRSELEQIADELQADPNSVQLLWKKAQTHFRLHEYDTCQDILTNLNIPAQDKLYKKKKQTMYLCAKFIDMEDKIDAARDCIQAEFPENWVARRLDDYIASETIQTTGADQQFACDPTSDNVFIVGFTQDQGYYDGYDAGVYRKYIGQIEQFPLAQACEDGFMYSKDQVFALLQRTASKQRCQGWYGDRQPRMLYTWPKVSWDCQYELTRPNEFLDVYYSSNAISDITHKLITWSFDTIAKRTQDFFVPQYQNLIDPNLTITTTSQGTPQWTATNFVIDEVIVPNAEIVYAIQLVSKRLVTRQLPWHTVRNVLDFASEAGTSCYYCYGRARIASQISELTPSKHLELYTAVEDIMTQALPALAKLSRPALLLPGMLQAVIKGQRIYLETCQNYDGVWHFDGKYEHIVAVVLYFYRYSGAIEGGELEFLAKQPRHEEFWVGGDCSPSPWTLKEVKEFWNEIPHCKVPVKQGQLVVFSNYQSVHRVLRMLSYGSDAQSPDGLSSRDFLAMFIVDQRYPLRTTESIIPDLGPFRERKIKRYEVFGDQIKPAGQIGIDGSVASSTGNGSCALVGWMSRFSNPNTDLNWFKDIPGREEGVAVMKKLNECPPTGRGGSWAVSDSILDELESSEDEEDYENYDYY